MGRFVDDILCTWDDVVWFLPIASPRHEQADSRAADPAGAPLEPEVQLQDLMRRERQLRRYMAALPSSREDLVAAPHVERRFVDPKRNDPVRRRVLVGFRIAAIGAAEAFEPASDGGELRAVARGRCGEEQAAEEGRGDRDT